MIGRTFSGRYRIVERIGIGGMAEVYRAQDTVLGRIVAVKVMLPQYAADTDFTRRFRQEAASAANLQSPYIVNVYDWGQDEGTYYIVMEYVRGGDLKTAIRERGAINQRKVAEIASQACQALSVAHGQDIVHRDVKPQNIMVQPDGNVKMMDFGIARAKNSMKSQTSSVLGTAHYISPEQAQGKELTAASDIYSLGVCMYEAITGQLPFDGPDAVSVAMKQVNEQPKPLHEIFPNVEPVLEAIVLRAMEKDPHKRFATALDMRHVLNDFLAGRARGRAAAAAILAGGSAAAAAAGTAAASNANDVTRQMNPNANQTTQMMGGIPSNQTTVMPAAGGMGVQQPGWNGQGGMVPPQGGGANVYRDNPQPPKKGKAKKILIALVIIAALAAAGYAAWTMLSTPPLTVPDVSGKTLEQATEELTEVGYSVGKTSEVYSDTVEAGLVVSTDPAAGKTAEKGSRIGITLSKGKEQVSVPDVAGSTEDSAKEALSSAGLKAKAGSSEYSDDVKKGRVIRTEPAAGEKVDKGSEVTYVLSKGANTKEVPWVTGQTQDTAYTNLENAGFTVNIVEDYSDDVDEDVVIWQDPAGETKQKKGTTITICVSLGQKMVEVPDVVGYTVSDARAILQNAGFEVSQTSDYSGDAVVTSQSTSGEAKEGATINITAKEPKPEPTPTPSSSASGGSTPSSSSAAIDDEEDDEEEDDA
ncbi:MAG: Stk1 family PASTA domain-containing Ser/Thr kinase [Coriobacteriia bacterium]|nr:Stk1 family PASTA domain-containing Ser/Thr kinase [Coriobacteriia bacterium]